MAVKPKLALIPSGVKASKVYSVLPSDGTGDFDFSRSGSATRVNKDGLIETVDSNVPRLNYPMIDGVVSGCPSLLLEPARTNLIQYSEDFSQSYWNKSGLLAPVSGFISPDGTLNATKITGVNNYGSVFIPSITVLSGVKYTYSVFAKKNISSKVSLRAFTTGNDTRVVFNLDDLSTNISEGYDIGYDSSSIEVYSNGWYKCILTVTTATTSLRLNIYPDSPNDVSSQSSFYIYGAQLEQGSYATSYIPTNGSTATRSAETCNGAGDANTFNDSEGVLMAEISALDNIGSFENLSLSNGNSTSRVFLFYRNSLNLMEFRVTVNNVIQMQFQYTIEDAKTFNKMLIKYKQNDFAVWINGFELHTDNSGITFNSYPLNNLSFDNGKVSAPTDPFYGNTKQLQYFDSALNDTDLETLTSWTSFNEMAESQLYSVY